MIADMVTAMTRPPVMPIATLMRPTSRGATAAWWLIVPNDMVAMSAHSGRCGREQRGYRRYGRARYDVLQVDEVMSSDAALRLLDG